MQWTPGTLSPGVKQLGHEADHSLPASTEVKNGGAIPPLPPVCLHAMVLNSAQVQLYVWLLPCWNFSVFMCTHPYLLRNVYVDGNAIGRSSLRVHIMVFCNVTLCELIGVYQRFAATYGLHLQGIQNFQMIKSEVPTLIWKTSFESTFCIVTLLFTARVAWRKALCLEI
jgi:hypothetical protein